MSEYVSRKDWKKIDKFLSCRGVSSQSKIEITLERKLQSKRFFCGRCAALWRIERRKKKWSIMFCSGVMVKTMSKNPFFWVFLKYWSRKLFQILRESSETMHFDRSRREESNGDVKTRLGFSEVLQKPLGFQKPPPNSSKNPTRWVLIFARVSSRLNKWSWRKRQKTSKSNVKGDYALFDSKIDITLERKLQSRKFFCWRCVTLWRIEWQKKKWVITLCSGVMVETMTF